QPGRLSTKPFIDQLAGYKSPNVLDDEIMPALTPSEQVVLRRLFRLSYGFNRTITDPVSYSKLSEKCHLGISALKDALRSLQMKNLIRVVGDNKYNPAGGNQYEIALDLVVKNLADKQPGRIVTKLDTNLANKQPGHNSTRSITGPIKDD